MKVTYELEYLDNTGEWCLSHVPPMESVWQADDVLAELAGHLSVKYRIVKVTREPEEATP